MITVESLTELVSKPEGPVFTGEIGPFALTVKRARWVHVATGPFIVAVKSKEPCAKMSTCARASAISRQGWLDEVPVHSVAIDLARLRGWHGATNGNDDPGNANRISVAWIDGRPFNRYIVRAALSLVETPQLMSWWADDIGPLLFADVENTWRVGIMPLTNMNGGKPWPRADRPRLVLRDTWERKAS